MHHCIGYLMAQCFKEHADVTCVQCLCYINTNNPLTRRIVRFQDEFRILSVTIFCLEHHAEMPAEIHRLSRSLGCQSRPDLNPLKRISSSSKTQARTQCSSLRNSEKSLSKTARKTIFIKSRSKTQRVMVRCTRSLEKRNQPQIIHRRYSSCIYSI